MSRRRLLDRDEAEAIGVRALAFLAGEPNRLARFLGLTGLGPGTLRAAAREPQFLARVLDHIAQDEALLVAAAADQDIAPERLASAHALLAAGGYRDDGH